MIKTSGFMVSALPLRIMPSNVLVLLLSGALVLGSKDMYIDLLREGHLLEARGEFALASRKYSEAVSMHPDQFQGYLVWGQGECRQNNTKACSKLFKEGIKRTPSEEQPSIKQNSYIELASAYYRERDFDHVLKALNSAIKADRFSSVVPELWCKVGHAHYDKAKLAGGGWTHNPHARKAVKAYRTATEMDQFASLDHDVQVSCYEVLGLISKHLDNFELAESALRSALALHPNTVGLRATLVEVLLWKGDEEGSSAAVAEGISMGIWERKDQTPGIFHRGIPSESWPDVSGYDVVQAVIEVIESKYSSLASEARGLIDLPKRKGLSFGNMQGLALPGNIEREGWHEKALECMHRRSETPVGCEVLDAVALTFGSSRVIGMFLRLQPGAVLRPHCGASNDRWTVHLGLEIPANVTITVGGERRHWVQGKCIVFDDSFRHSVIHAGYSDRLVFGIQIPSPKFETVSVKKRSGSRQQEL